MKTWPSVVKATEMWLPQRTFMNLTPLSWSSLVGVVLLLSELGPRPSLPQLLSPHDQRQPGQHWKAEQGSAASEYTHTHVLTCAGATLLVTMPHACQPHQRSGLHMTTHMQATSRDAPSLSTARECPSSLPQPTSTILTSFRASTTFGLFTSSMLPGKHASHIHN